MSYATTMTVQEYASYRSNTLISKPNQARNQPAGQPFLPPAKAMKVLGYPGTEVVASAPKVFSNTKKPILHRIQTSLSQSVSLPGSPVETNFKSDSSATVKHKKSKMLTKQSATDKADTRSSRPANSNKNFRPLPYAAAVQINMFLDGGSEDDWLSRSRKAGEHGIGSGVEIGGFRDENGLVWWDAEEKMEWTSLIPKASGQSGNYEPWVDFNSDEGLSSAISTDSTGSWASMDKPFVEVDTGFPVMPANDLTRRNLKPGAYLFPINKEESLTTSATTPASFSARNTSGAHRRREAPPPLRIRPPSSRSSLVLSPGPVASPRGMHKSGSQSLVNLESGFDDHFVRGGAAPSTVIPRERLQGVKSSGSKRGLSLKTMWGK